MCSENLSAAVLTLIS